MMMLNNPKQNAQVEGEEESQDKKCEMGSTESSPCRTIPTPSPRLAIPPPPPPTITTTVGAEDTKPDIYMLMGDVKPDVPPPIERLSGAVASEHRSASDVGAKVLQRGGNAVDAVIATVIAVGTLCPYHSDIGGGGFAIVRLPPKEGSGSTGGRYESLDFRHVAPAAATTEFYRNPEISLCVGGAAVAVPGELRGLEELHKRHGRLEWKELFQGSIEMAENGVPVGRDLYEKIIAKNLPDPSYSNTKWMLADPAFSAFIEDGQALPVGATIRRPEYARTLRKIANEGADAFYTGEIAEALVAAVRERGGLMTVDDLKNYKPRWNTPLSTRYRDHTCWASPAPASGAIWLSAMGVLSHFPPTEQGSVLDLHRLTEALRLAYGQRTALGDPAFVPGLEEAQRSWLSAEALEKRAKMIDDSTTFPPDYYKPPNVEIVQDNGTSNITAADSDGLVVSITTTVGLYWGSQIIVPGHGFLLNGSMDDFSVEGRPNFFGYEPQVANYVKPGKRPLSSSCPYIIESASGHVVLAGGAAGGSTIISTNTQVALNVLSYGLSAADALKAPRLHNQILPDHTVFERPSVHSGSVEGFSAVQVEGLRGKGHAVEWVEQARNTACAIRFVPVPVSVSEEWPRTKKEKYCDWEAVGDPRKFDSGGSVYHA